MSAKNGALQSFLQDSNITTLFLGGVNSDQCVWNTILDAYARGLDTIYVQDCAGTSNPDFAEEMVRYNVNRSGFQTTSTHIVAALGGSSNL